MEQGNKLLPEEENLADELREAFGLTPGASGFEADLSLSVSAASSAAADWPKVTVPLSTGTRLGDFEILEEVGRGGMGVVYRARQESLGREVALKVLPDTGRSGKRAVDRFHTEAQAAARLHHTNIVSIYGQGEDGGRHYYAMELIEGESLDAAIRERTRLLCPSNPQLQRSAARPSSAATSIAPPRIVGSSAEIVPAEAEAPSVASTPGDVQSGSVLADSRALRRHLSDFRHLADLLAGVADALDHAHKAGVLHRDIKPQNLLVGRDERLHITDFGLARLADQDGLTLSGEVLGTPAYLAPEQVIADHGSIDERTDIYALGVTLYELLTLRRPFRGATREQVLTGICHQQPELPRQLDPAIPRDLQTICLKAISKDPNDRYATAAAMAEDLRRFATDRPILSRPPAWYVKAGKWMRRHRAATTAICAIALAVILSAGLTASMISKRRAAARQLIEEVNQRIVLQNYRQIDDALDALDRAEGYGGDPAEIGLLRALATWFTGNNSGARDAAIAILQQVKEDHPEHLPARYLLAAAFDRNFRIKESDAEIAEADVLLDSAEAQGTDDPRARFFRGFTLHFDHPDAAIDDYRQARTRAAKDGVAFLQATMQLARAHNQRLWVHRDYEDYVHARDALRLLISFDVYEGYPYFLLIYAERIAAEFYDGNDATQVADNDAEEHFQASLELADECTSEFPDYPNCYLAAGHTHEVMGNFDDAAAAYSEVIDRWESNPDRACAALHYRWRNYYWLGTAGNSALEDLARHQAECLQPNELPTQTHDHVFPALILADQGKSDEAREHALALTRTAETSPNAVIWTATTLRLIGEADAANQHLARYADTVDFENDDRQDYQSVAWMTALYQLAQGQVSVEHCNAMAKETAEPWRLIGEAEFHAAALALSKGNRTAAREGFLRAHRSYDSSVRYTYLGRMIEQKMRADENWPAWLGDPLEFGASNHVKGREDPGRQDR